MCVVVKSVMRDASSVCGVWLHVWCVVVALVCVLCGVCVVCMASLA